MGGGAVNAILIAGFVLIAGLTPVAAKFAMNEFPPLATGFLRFAIGGALLLATYRFLPGDPAARQRRIEKRDMPRLILAAAICVPVNQFCFLTGVKLSSASHAGLFYALTPVITYLITLALGRAFWSARMGMATLLAFVGAATLAKDGLNLGPQTARGDALLFMTVFSWASYSIAMAPLLPKYGAVRCAALVMTIGAALYLPALFIDGAQILAADISWRGWAGFWYLTLGTSFINYALWFIALSRLDINRVSVAANTSPIVSVIGAWLMLGDPLTPWLIAGATLLILAILLANVEKLRALRRSIVARG